MRSMKRRLALHPPLLAVLLLLAGMASAADPVGTWALDEDAFRGELQRLMETELARMPAGERAQVEGAIAAQIDEMVRRSAGTMEFRPDGTVLSDDAEGGPQTGRWTAEGDRIRLVTGRDPPYVGTIEGDTMRLRPEDGAEAGMEIVLKRR